MHLGLYQNETAELCQWHVNEAHYLEAWGDARAYDGTVSIVQPLIAPLYNGKSAYELVAMLSGQAELRATKSCRLTGRSSTPAPTSTHSGENRCTMAGWKALRSRRSTCRDKTAGFPSTPGADPKAIEINFRRDPSVYDGQFSNNGWLQELPKPMNKLTWDNPVLMGPAMAERMGDQNRRPGRART